MIATHPRAYHDMIYRVYVSLISLFVCFLV
jgi:hypothetical protein